MGHLAKLRIHPLPSASPPDNTTANSPALLEKHASGYDASNFLLFHLLLWCRHSQAPGPAWDTIPGWKVFGPAQFLSPDCEAKKISSWEQEAESGLLN